MRRAACGVVEKLIYMGITLLLPIFGLVYVNFIPFGLHTRNQVLWSHFVNGILLSILVVLVGVVVYANIKRLSTGWHGRDTSGSILYVTVVVVVGLLEIFYAVTAFNLLITAFFTVG